jgi:malate synthase
VFDAKLGNKPNQKQNLREDVNVTAANLLDFRVPNGVITEVRVRVCVDRL